MNIQVSPAPRQNLLGGPENMMTELKTSIFFASGEQIPGLRQYHQIAKTIAGFINGEGGILWIGVDDKDNPTGVESDLAVLGGGSARPCRGPLSNDEGKTFGGTADQYILKLKELVKAYLGPSAEKYIAGAMASTVNDKIVVKVPVKKADAGYVAYVYKWFPGEHKYSEELYQRAANGTSHLEGSARDEFIRGKCREEFRKELATLQNNAAGLTKAELVAALQEIQNTTVIGQSVTVNGAVALDDPNFAALKSPKGFVFDGAHVCDVKTWKDAFGANEQQLTKWTADIVSDGVVHEYGEANRKLILNCYDLGAVIALTHASYYCDNWPSFEIKFCLNGHECWVGHRHSILASNGGIWCKNVHGRETLDFLSERARINVFEDGKPSGLVGRESLLEKARGIEKIEVWISDPRIHYVAYATFLETPERIWSLLDPLPEMEDAIRLLLRYNLYRPRLSASLDWRGGDPYQDMHSLYDDIKSYGRDIFNYIKE